MNPAGSQTETRRKALLTGGGSGALRIELLTDPPLVNGTEVHAQEARLLRLFVLYHYGDRYGDQGAIVPRDVVHEVLSLNGRPKEASVPKYISLLNRNLVRPISHVRGHGWRTLRVGDGDVLDVAEYVDALEQVEQWLAASPADRALDTAGVDACVRTLTEAWKANPLSGFDDCELPGLDPRVFEAMHDRAIDLVEEYGRRWKTPSHARNGHEAHLQARGGAGVDRVLNAHKSALVSPYLELGWGDAVSLRDCPERAGWPLADVRIHRTGSRFSMPSHLRGRYDEWFRANYERERLQHDGVKFGLLRDPTSLSDAPNLVLDVVSNTYSEAVFYQGALSDGARRELVRAFVGEQQPAGFPQRFCMQGVIICADHRILVTQRAHDLSFEPGRWSVSVEEQLAPKDFDDGEGRAALRWGQRLLWEELRLDSVVCPEEAMLAVSVFVEAHVPNVSLCVLFKLTCDSGELAAKLRAGGRPDKECIDFAFLDASEEGLWKELLRPSREYHSTSEYRVLMTARHLYGLPGDEELANWVADHSQ